MLNIQKMMQQAKLVQEKLEEIQEKLKDIDVSGASGDGLVRVTMSCANVVRSVTIDPSLLNAGGKDMLEDLVVAAMNNAGEAKDVRVKEETRKMMDSIGVDENTKFPF
ncbi:MAG TPA: YbaB/EbfC family nucleoid-associated protein [Alphaproteobacteria bacterium]|nr:YbaB/EbfC family nucleoid-associated protein [Micavibrio sp.]HQX26800.1 YbaB/EbfC family nucleoid-associated protein [Alphaproteobacteria bacterium]